MIRISTAILASLTLLSLSCSVVGVPTSRGPQATPVAAAAALVPAPAPRTPEELGVRSFLASRATGLTDAEIDAVAAAIVVAAARHAVPLPLVLAVIEVESGGDAFAVSHAGALGLMQLLPGTGEALAPAAGVDWLGERTLFDPEANVRIGVAYLERLIARYEDIEVALAAYNWGPTRISKKLRRGDALPAEYVRRVRAALPMELTI